jgi:hypothetical protein
VCVDRFEVHQRRAGHKSDTGPAGSAESLDRRRPLPVEGKEGANGRSNSAE